MLQVLHSVRTMLDRNKRLGPAPVGLSHEEVGAWLEGLACFYCERRGSWKSMRKHSISTTAIMLEGSDLVVVAVKANEGICVPCL